MALTINGTFVKALPTQEGESSHGHWVRGGFVIEYGEEYPRKVAFSLFGEDKVAQANLPAGTPVQVRFSPESREYQDRWYTELRCISLTPLQQQDYAPVATQAARLVPPAQPAAPSVMMPNSNDPDLPF